MSTIAISPLAEELLSWSKTSMKLTMTSPTSVVMASEIITVKPWYNPRMTAKESLFVISS